MNIITIIVSVLCTGIAQLLFKQGMQSYQPIQGQSFIFFLLKNPYIIGGLGMMGLGALIRFYVLSKNPVSFAYPFVSLSFIITLIGGSYFFKEQITMQGILGMSIILIGIFIISYHHS